MNLTKKKYNKEFRKIKPVILIRDNFECQLDCEECWGELDVHHIKARSTGGKNEKKNLITLCRKSHNEIELMSREKSIEICRNILIKKYNYKY